MKFALVGVLLLVCCVTATRRGWAHHGSGGAGSAGSRQVISERLNAPGRNVFFTFEVNEMDEGVGTYLLYQLQGEYAFTRRFSLGASLPFWTVRQNFVPDNTRIGDVALRLKGLPWSSTTGRMGLLLGLDTSFPTGNNEESLGAGAVTFSPYATFGTDFQVLQVFATATGIFEAAGSVNPTMGYALGLVVPLIKGKVPVKGLLFFQGTTVLEGDTFTSGSSKGFLIPGFLLSLSEHWEASFAGKISVMDTLNFRSDVTSTDFATGLFTDVKAGFIFNLGYIF